MAEVGLNDNGPFVRKELAFNECSSPMRSMEPGKEKLDKNGDKPDSVNA